MDKTFSEKQIRITKYLMDLQNDIDNRIRNDIQESFLRKTMDDETLDDIVNSLENGIKYIVDEKINAIKNIR